MGGGATEAGAVAATFAALRKRILDNLDAVEATARLEARPLDAIAPSYARARRLVAEETFYLSVVGAEGSGKSTFLNVLMGTQMGTLLPTDEHLPGTVAPVELRYGQTQTPRRAVLYQGREDAPEACADEGAFARLLLQRHNMRNNAGVARGVVSLDHDALRNGLTIVDMPGINGVDETVRAQAAASMHDYTRSVIGLTRDRRQHADLIEIFQSYQVRAPRAIIIVNVDIEQVDERLARVHQDGARVPQILDDKRRGTVAAFAAQGITLNPEQVFVVCLPVLGGLVTAKEYTIHKAHADEARAMRKAVWTLIERQSAATAITDAAATAVSALEEMERHLRTLDTFYDMVLTSAQAGSSARRAVEQTVTAALAEARELSDDVVFDPDRLSKRIDDFWAEHLVAPTREARAQLHRYLSQKLFELEGEPGITAVDVAQRQAEIEAFTRTASEGIARARNAAIWAFIEELCADADAVVYQVYAAAPELQALADAGQQVSVTPSSLPDIRVTRDQPDLFLYLWKVGAPLGGGVLGAVAAGLLASLGVAVSPVIAVPLLVVLGGGAGWYAARREIGGTQGEMRRFLERSLEALDDLGEAPEGPLFDQWRVVCIKMVTQVRLAQTRALDAVEMLFRTDDASQVALRERRDHGRETLAVIGGARHDLLKIPTQVSGRT